MKRSWIGFLLLILLLIGSVFVTYIMEQIHSRVEDTLNEAAQAALEEDWTQAKIFYDAAKNDWDSYQAFRGCFSDHSPAEDIDALFSSVELYGVYHETVEFAAGCRVLARKTAAIGEAHQMVWWNFF